ncbi:MAG: hypothetical protein FWG64_09970 [Firmicutes bacterium]|nr:hypothetical protein [Bacillota bacterium]
MTITQQRIRDFQTEREEFWAFLDDLQSDVHKKLAASMTKLEDEIMVIFGRFPPTGENTTISQLYDFRRQLGLFASNNYWQNETLAQKAQYYGNANRLNVNTAFEIILLGKMTEIFHKLATEIKPQYEEVYRQKLQYYINNEDFAETAPLPNWSETVLPPARPGGNGYTMFAQLYNQLTNRANQILQALSQSASEENINRQPTRRTGNVSSNNEDVDDEIIAVPLDRNRLHQQLRALQNRMLKKSENATTNWHGLFDFFLNIGIGYATISAMRERYRRWQRQQNLQNQNAQNNQNNLQQLPPQSEVTATPEIPETSENQPGYEEEFLFIAVLDDRTTQTCTNLNGQIFKVSEAVLGVNVPPIANPPHPCRSIIVFDLPVRQAGENSTHNATEFQQELQQEDRSVYSSVDELAYAAHYDTSEMANRPDNLQNVRGYIDRLGNRGIMGSMENIDDRSSGGLRRSPFTTLSAEEIEHLRAEIRAISADESVFLFNNGRQTGYSDENDIIRVRYDVFSDTNSTHPRDLMSERAVLAHEYYGHRANRGTTLPSGSWNDEFRASYLAARNAPNLSDEDRRYLILDAIERARESGIPIRYNDFMRRTIYGY